MGERLIYCEKCGQELIRGSCEFCGQESLIESSSLPHTSENVKSHEGLLGKTQVMKKYKAAMVVISTLAAIGLFFAPYPQGVDMALVDLRSEFEPSNNEDSPTRAETSGEDQHTINREKLIEESPGHSSTQQELITGQGKIDEDQSHENGDKPPSGNPTEEVVSQPGNLNPEEEVDLNPDTSGEESTLADETYHPLASEEERAKFFGWRETLSFDSKPPNAVEKTGGYNCIGDYCVWEQICFSFDSPETFSLSDLELEIFSTIGDVQSGVSPILSISKDHTELCHSFLNEDPGNLSQYVQDNRVELSFPYFGTSIEVATKSGIFDLR